jgi:hypothetical protein
LVAVQEKETPGVVDLAVNIVCPVKSSGTVSTGVMKGSVSLGIPVVRLGGLQGRNGA